VIEEETMIFSVECGVLLKPMHMRDYERVQGDVHL